MNIILNVPGVGPVDLSYSERGTGSAVLLLHGGAGPLSVVPWGELLARTRSLRVITPTHPGFFGTPRPEALSSIDGLARTYAAFLDRLGIERCLVIGNSIGGWIAEELALLAPHRVAGLVIVDGPGIEVPGHPVVDVFSLPFEELAQRSYHDPARFRVDPTTFTPTQRAGMAGNFAALKVYAGTMADPTLRSRLAGIRMPTLVVWGESDRMVDVEYGRTLAASIPAATFQLMLGAGHLPQIETPEVLVEVVGTFMTQHPLR
jgi:pimeloyl-ACP methyl ester carboxylesterase